jgi:hypothetical protein
MGQLVVFEAYANSHCVLCPFSKLDYGLPNINILCNFNQWTDINFFRPFKGLRKGYHFSHLLFLIMVEVLSRALLDARRS